MKTLKLFVMLTFCITTSTYAQTAEEIVDTYIENIGGNDAWSKINSMEVKGIGKQQGVDYPFVATYLKDGRGVINVDIQGNSFIFEAFDGETAWAMNFQTQKAEAWDSEESYNYKIDAKDNIPDAFMDYKEKGYAIELLGKESWEGTECFKIKLTKTPLMVDGKKEDNVEFYFFDIENSVPIAMESAVMSGPAKGATAVSLFSDYQEVDGLYMPFTRIDKFNGQVGLEMIFKSVSFNTEVDESIFKMPKE